MSNYIIPTLPLNLDLESTQVLKQLNLANKKLAELKGIARSIPNENILISTLTLQEAKDSSEIENIVTTQDDLFKSDLNLDLSIKYPAAKEVLNYRQAIQIGFNLVKQNNLLTINTIKEVQQSLEHNKAGFRSVPGTQLKSDSGVVVYTPPQDLATINSLMSNLEQFINDPQLSDLDPLIKMAIIHHQFESIHPFYDGNGRTGRIINVLYLVSAGLLDLPILYLSRYITHNKTEYYKLIQAIRDKNDNNATEWQAWILFILKGVEQTADHTIILVKNIADLMSHYKQILRPLFGNKYNHDLLNHLFFHPYTKIEFMQQAMNVSRNTAIKYLNTIVNAGLLQKLKLGTNNYYINHHLLSLFTSPPNN